MTSLEDWEVQELTLQELLYKGLSPSFVDFIDQLAKTRAGQELPKLLSDPETQTVWRAYLKAQVTKAKQRLAYRERDLKDFEDLLEKLGVKA